MMVWHAEWVPHSTARSAYGLGHQTVSDEPLGDLHDVAGRMHLQWFAAEDEGRTEDPTEQKIRKAREEEGKVAKSADVTSAIMLVLATLTIAVLSRWLWNTMLEMVGFFVRQTGEINPRSEAGVLAAAFYSYLIRLSLPVAAVCFVAALAGNLMQVGFMFTPKPITPDPKRIAPNFGKWIKRSFGGEEAAYNMAKNLGKIFLILLVSVLTVQPQIGRLIRLVDGTPYHGVILIAELAFRILLWTGVIFLVLSLFDYFFQKRQHLESLKMTKQEVKEERKTYEGDPHIRSRLRQRMQEVLSRNMMQKVPTADVVVTNPTHFAVALEYDRRTMEAPTVTAKGQDHVAQRIKALAAENDVPVIENKPLARALHDEVEIGDLVPERYYEAVVAVLKHVYALNAGAKREKWWGGV